MRQYSITNLTTVDRWAAIKLADLLYVPGSSRPDDRGALWISPIIEEEDPLVYAIYASTNGDPVLYLGRIENGEVTWFEELDRGIVNAIDQATWIHPPTGEGYSFLVQESCTSDEREYYNANDTDVL